MGRNDGSELRNSVVDLFCYLYLDELNLSRGQKIGEAAMSVKQAADTVNDMTEALYDVIKSVTRPLWDHTQTHTREMEVA